MIDVQSTALMQYLHRKSDLYYGKALELRSEIQGWLEYVPQTFPHYTRHTIGHSEAIIAQISRFTFRDDEGKDPVLNLSRTEAYILIAAAYLHDAGMVAADSEKAKILEEEEWMNWTTGDGSAADRWRQILELRAGDAPAHETVRHFLADLETRYLLAEYLRRVHHERAGDVIEQHESSLGRFAFSDPELQSAIADVCISHGLSREALDDRVRFPLLRQIRGDDVNLRLLAIILRLGDLLDLHNSRACPLLLNAACPLPSESYAHWEQYQRITHRAVSPDNIEVRASCEEPEEHRVLRDWCQWIVDELGAAPRLLAGAQRHGEWVPPAARMSGNDPTIEIAPAPGAKYRSRDWKFQLDETEIFERLISDAYERPTDFVRELIQNAMDATRCQIYEDLQEEGRSTPRSPTKVPEEFLSRYQIKISVRNQSITNEHTGATEERQIVCVEDFGIGMDEDVITRHFLQVGRSYYTTSDFRRRYKFVPSSRFGIGFLSVFAASDHVTVETLKPSSAQEDGPLRLSLTGPRTYMIVEAGNRRHSGTQIDVRLRPNVRLAPGDLTKLVRDWCKKLEVTVRLDDFGKTSVVEAEEPEEFVFEVPDIANEGAVFKLRHFSLDDDAIEGDLYVLAHKKIDGTEDWSLAGWYVGEYLRKHPQAEFRDLPEMLSCFQGISMPQFGREHYYYQPYREMISRVDLRNTSKRPILSRRSMRHPFGANMRGGLRWSRKFGQVAKVYSTG
jgi:hypothetical protein